MKGNRKMKKIVTGVCLTMALGAVAGTGKLDYFEPKALANADMSGVKEGIERQLGRCAAEFAAAEELVAKRSGRERAMILDRVEIGRRLERYVRERHLDGAKDLELMAWQGAEELRNLWCYFAAEKRREEARAKAPTPIVINLRDFGAKGNGKTDDGEAFRRAFAAAKAKGGQPVVLKVPKGVYLVEPEAEDVGAGRAGNGAVGAGRAGNGAVGAGRAGNEAAGRVGTVSAAPRGGERKVAFRSYRDYDEKGLPTSGVRERPWKDFGAGFHLTCHGFANFTIQGEAGTEVRFTDSAQGGFGFFGCTETVLKDLAISYRDNPSTQGVIESVDEKDVGFVFKRDPGYPDPDEPRFIKAHSRRFTVHEPNGLVGYDGTGRMGTVERLSADRFLFRPYAHMKNNSYWTQRKAGERVVVIARYSESAKAFPACWSLCSFSGAEGVRVYDSPGQNFIMFSTFAMRLLDCGALVRHGSDDLLSANADGMMGSGPIGPYVDGCRFLHMEDDGFNITTAGGVVNSVSEDRLTFLSGFDGPSAFQVDGVTGRIKSFLRRDKAWNRVKQPFVAETLSQAELDGGTLKAHDMSAWLVSNSWNGVKGERKADRTIQIPGTFGGVIRNTTLHDLRGMGVQVHCANMLLDNVTVDRTSGPGMKIAPLFGWGMMFDVHNILVRNCTFRDCSDALSVVPGSVQPGVEISQKMIQSIHLENNRFEVREGHKALVAANAAEVRVDGAKFRLYLKRDPAGKAGSATVDSDYADRVSMEVKADGTEEVTYWFGSAARGAPETGVRREDAPVPYAVVTIRTDPVDGAKRYTLRAKLADGWFLERTRFPEYDLPLVRGGDAEDDCVIVGSTKGGYWTNLEAKQPGWHYYACQPGRSSAQFAAAWDGESGVYFGLEDASGEIKFWGFDRTAAGLRFVHENRTWQSGGYAQTYPVVIRPVRRTGEPLVWQDFADIYRAWDRKQSWSRTTYRDRADVPAWMKDAPVFTRFSRQWLERPDDIRRFVAWWKRELGEMPVVAALWGWEKYGTWWGPDYFPCHPSDEVFTANMKFLGDNAFHPFAWPSGYNWCKYIGDKGDGTYEIDLRDSWLKPNEDHLVVNADGKFYHRDAFWLRFGALTAVCGGDPWTHDWWNGLTKDLARRGVDIVQVDQVVGGRFLPCWNPKHGHPVGDGAWMWPKFRLQIETMRAAIKSVRPDGFVGVEEPCELFNDIVGIQDYRDLESDGDRFASVYSYLYHGYVPAFQSNPFRDEFYSLAHMAADGQMPFYRPDFAELDATRPALVNGDFENLVDSVRGATGWDRLIPSRMLKGVDPAKPLWNFTGYNNMGWLGYAVTLDYTVKHGGAVSLKFDPPTKGGFDKGAPMQVSQTVEGLEPGVYTVSAWVKADDPAAPRGELKYGTCAGGELGRIAFPAKADWTLVSAEVRVKDALRLIIWAPPGARFHVDDVKLERAGAEVRVSGDSAYTAFMKKWIWLYRGEGRAFLADGFQVKPPRLKCETVRIAMREEPAVCHAAYVSEKGEKALVLANATAKPQKVVCRWQGRRLELTIAPRDIRLVR